MSRVPIPAYAAHNGCARKGRQTMTLYVALINTPGYLPEVDPVYFDGAREAWQYLVSERMRAEDEYLGIPDNPSDPDGPCHYSDTVIRLKAEAYAVDVDGRTMSGEGCVYGNTPGYDGSHDLGVAYSVTVVACSWFAQCDRAATHLRPHPVLSTPGTDEGIPCCDRCAGLTALSYES